MRFLLFLLGVVGSVVAGFAGLILYGTQIGREATAFAQQNGVEFNADVYLSDPLALTTQKIAYLLLAGAALGLLGSLFVLMRRGKQGATLMLLAALGPAVFHPLTLAATGLLVLTGVLSLFIRPLPVVEDVPVAGGALAVE